MIYTNVETAICSLDEATYQSKAGLNDERINDRMMLKAVYCLCFI